MATGLTEHRFLTWLLGSAVALAALVAGVNAWIDPFLIFGRDRIAHISDLKPAVATHEPLLKAYLADRAQPRTLILGSSRSGIGLNPDSPAWPASMQPVVNLSVVGTDLGQQLDYLRLLTLRADRPARPGHLVVGLDFESFLHSADSLQRPPRAPDEQAERLAALARHDLGRQWQLLKDAAQATVTMDAVAASVSTVFTSLKREGNDLSASGRTSEWQFRSWMRADGAARLFDQKLSLSARQLGRQPLSLGTADEPVRGLRELRTLLDWSRAQGVSVSLLLQPSHALHLLLLDRLGLWPQVEAWKRAVVGEAAHARAVGARVEVWDVCAFEPECAEPVPAQGRAPTRWFWDPVHHSSGLGDLVIATTQRRTDLQRLSREPLTPDAVDDRLGEVRARKAAFIAASPALVDAIARLAPPARPAADRLP